MGSDLHSQEMEVRGDAILAKLVAGDPPPPTSSSDRGEPKSAGRSTADVRSLSVKSSGH